MEFRKPAVKIVQGKRTLFLAFLSVRDFMAEGFYRVDRLDVKRGEGIQRLLNEARAKSFGKDILAADEHNEAFLPTSVFLATGKKISYDEQKKELFFNSIPHVDGVCPLDVVDGQHRIEGLIRAARKNENLLDFPVSTAIAPDLNEAEKMLQFVTVNTKQKAVDKGVAQHIIARFTQMDGVEKLPFVPQWLSKEIKKGNIDESLDIAKALNNDEKSPWYGRIQFSDEAKKTPRHSVRQQTFVNVVKKYLLSRGQPFSRGHPFSFYEEQKRLRILMNFWTAVENIFVLPLAKDDAEVNSIVFKGNGLVFFHYIFTSVINQLAKEKDYTIGAMEKCIYSAQDYLSTDMVAIMTPEFWQSGDSASRLIPQSIDKHAAEFVHALNQAAQDDIQQATQDDIQV